MYFSGLPEHLQKQIEKLTIDEQFQERFGTDKQLDQIENMKLNKDTLLRQFEYLINGYEKVLDKTVYPLTLSKVTFLWLKNSPFFLSNIDINSITQEDLDLFFYILDTNMREINLNYSKSLSIDYFGKHYAPLTFEER